MKSEYKKNTTKIGNLGEAIAAKYLRSKGFRIVARNYRKKYGEIDIIAEKLSVATEPVAVSYEMFGKGEGGLFSRETPSVIHFVEVKSVSYETKTQLEWAVSHETWRPEELVHAFKLNQIRKAAESWIFENNWAGEVQIDVVAVRMVSREKYATVKYIPRVISE